MLSRDEQRAWDEIRSRFAEEAEEPARPVLDPAARRPRPSGTADLVVAVAGVSAAVLLVVLGAPVVGLAVAVAVAPRWLLWRYRYLLDDGAGTPAPSAPRDVLPDGDGHRSSRGSRHRR